MKMARNDTNEKHHAHDSPNYSGDGLTIPSMYQSEGPGLLRPNSEHIVGV